MIFDMFDFDILVVCIHVVFCLVICSQQVDSQAHCLAGPVWQDLREDIDLTFIEDIVPYIRRTLQARAEREEEEKERRKTERN